jgi:hypothetical protein
MRRDFHTIQRSGILDYLVSLAVSFHPTRSISFSSRTV